MVKTQITNHERIINADVHVVAASCSTNLGPDAAEMQNLQVSVNGHGKILSKKHSVRDPKKSGVVGADKRNVMLDDGDGGKSIGSHDSIMKDNVEEEEIEDDGADSENYFCFHCDTRDRKVTMDGLVQHFKECHLVEEESKVTLQCKMCPKKYITGRPVRSAVFFSILSCLNHMVEKHEVMVPDFAKLYRCTSCSYTTLIYQSFVRHRSQHDSSLSRCDTCDKLMKPMSLKNHVRTCGSAQQESDKEVRIPALSTSQKRGGHPGFLGH